MPWTMKVVFSSTRIDMAQTAAASITMDIRSWPPRSRWTSDRGPLDALDGPPSGLVQGDRPVGVGDAIMLEDLEALLLPGSGDAEDGDLLGRVVAELQTGLDDSAGHDVHTRVGDDRHHHGDLVDAGLLQDQ